MKSIVVQYSLCMYSLNGNFTFNIRYQAQDYNGQILAEVSALKAPRPAFAPLFTNQFGVHQNWTNKVCKVCVNIKENAYLSLNVLIEWYHFLLYNGF